MEYLGGVSRFKAETLAAKEQGLQRWEAIGHVARRVVEAAADQRQALAQRERKDAMPEVQPSAKEEGRPMPERGRG